MNVQAVVLGIVVALPEELATLTKQKLVKGELIELRKNILVIFAGTGPENAERAVSLLVGYGANALMSWGCAAALSHTLKPGDLLIPVHVSSEQGQLFSTDQQWLRVLKKCLLGKCTFTSDLLVESRGLVATSVEKQHIQQASKAFALDMESAAIFKAAQQLGLPCVAIRAIADPVTMDLPQSVVKSLNLAGQVDLAKLLKYLLFHPQELCALVNLGLHFHAAGKTLRKVAAQLDEILGFIEASGA